MISAPAEITAPGSPSYHSSWSRNSARTMPGLRLPARGGHGQIAAELISAHLGLLPAGHVTHRDRGRLRLRRAADQRPGCALIAGPFQLPAELAGGAQVDAGPQACAARDAGEREGPGGEILAQDRDGDVQPAPAAGLAAAAQQQDPLDAQRAAGGRHIRSAELLDQVVLVVSAP